MQHTSFVLQYNYACFIDTEHIVNNVLAIDMRWVQNAIQCLQTQHSLKTKTGLELNLHTAQTMEVMNR